MSQCSCPLVFISVLSTDHSRCQLTNSLTIYRPAFACATALPECNDPKTIRSSAALAANGSHRCHPARYPPCLPCSSSLEETSALQLPARGRPCCLQTGLRSHPGHRQHRPCHLLPGLSPPAPACAWPRRLGLPASQRHAYLPPGADARPRLAEPLAPHQSDHLHPQHPTHHHQHRQSWRELPVACLPLPSWPDAPRPPAHAWPAQPGADGPTQPCARQPRALQPRLLQHDGAQPPCLLPTALQRSEMMNDPGHHHGQGHPMRACLHEHPHQSHRRPHRCWRRCCCHQRRGCWRRDHRHRDHRRCGHRHCFHHCCHHRSHPCYRHQRCCHPRRYRQWNRSPCRQQRCHHHRSCQARTRQAVSETLARGHRQAAGHRVGYWSIRAALLQG
mmetsp:Transcript_34423/g.75323  ORF Transcript_34423/g.75323 Transcript_34423/m.75323 type:complete len:389 (-) Transcript_34423:123-1289(-)